MTKPATWDRLREAVATLPEPFGREEILSWFRRHHPETNSGTISAHIQFATSNAPTESRGGFAHRTPLLTRIARGQYIRYQGSPGLLSTSPDQAALKTGTEPLAPSHERAMVVAGSVRLSDGLDRLASQRPVFHSEADFQHALAWALHELDPRMRVRLESHPEPTIRLDLLLERPDTKRATAIELKYMTAVWSGDVDAEEFNVKNHGAQDIVGYDVVKDIGRVERLVRSRPGWNGAVICLSNDPSYWRRPGHGRVTNADAFRLYEGSRLSGTRMWGPMTGKGTMQGRETSIELRGEYVIQWSAYSMLDGARGEFRVLVFEVEEESPDRV